MLSLLVFIAVLSTLILVHEFGHFALARATGVRVEKFSLGFGPQIFKKKKGDTEYSLSLLPLGGYVKLAGDALEECKGAADEYFSKPVGKRFWIISSGALLNYIMGALFLWFVFFAGYPTFTTKVGGLLDGFGAKDSGVLAGDTIIAIDGQSIKYWDELQEIVKKKQLPTRVSLVILRDNQEKVIDVALKEKELSDELGDTRKVGLLGITPDSDSLVMVRHGIVESFFLSLKKTLDFTVMTYKGLWKMVSGKISMKDSVTGPLGIFFITSKAANFGIIAVLHLIAVLSISLGIFNLLPLPVLDGGHIILLAIEKIRRKSLGIKAERVINQVGVTFIVSLALFVTYNDVVRLFGDKISRMFKG
jgi:regulator of sigma E protease